MTSMRPWLLIDVDFTLNPDLSAVWDGVIAASNSAPGGHGVKVDPVTGMSAADIQEAVRLLEERNTLVER